MIILLPLLFGWELKVKFVINGIVGGRTGGGGGGVLWIPNVKATRTDNN